MASKKRQTVNLLQALLLVGCATGLPAARPAAAADVWTSLRQAQNDYQLVPGANDVQRRYILALRDARLPAAALKVARQHPGTLTLQEYRELEADEAAEWVRLASAPTRTQEERFALADRALEGVAVPDYILNEVAAAWLYLKQPEKAAALYRVVLTTDRIDDQELNDDRLAFYYALRESGQHDTAREQMTHWVAQQPAWRPVKGNPQPLPSEAWLNLTRTAATSNLFDPLTGKLVPGTVETDNFIITIANADGGMLAITTTDKATGDFTSFEVSQ